MIRRSIIYTNYLLFGLSALVVVGLAHARLTRAAPAAPAVIMHSQESIPSLPKGSFVQEEGSYQKIGEPLLRVAHSPPRLHLPDLRPHLTFLGFNARPDAQGEETVMHFTLAKSEEGIALSPGKRQFLRFDNSQKPGHYIPSSSPTSLWIEAEPRNKEAIVTVTMANPEGEEIEDPPALHTLELNARPAPHNAQDPWMLDEHRVDPTLLSRLHARWEGQDAFLRAHGGEEFAHVTDKESIQLHHDELAYRLHMKEGECAIWNQGNFIATKPGPHTKNSPLLCVDSVHDRLIRLTLWDVGGKRRMSLSLIKIRENWNPSALYEKIKFVSARTRSHYIFELEGKRYTLTPKDWVLQTQDGWRILNTLEEVDTYVERQLRGTLLVFEGVVDGEEGAPPLLRATLYSPERTTSQHIEWPLGQSSQAVAASPVEKENRAIAEKPLSYPSNLSSIDPEELKEDLALAEELDLLFFGEQLVEDLEEE